jgi:hypothetical protein
MRVSPCLSAALALAALALPCAAAGESAESCVTYAGEARYGAMGYNHLVHITNRCSVAADCSVSTDVSPDPVPTEVGPKSEVTVTTFLGSPARTFTPHVKCTMRTP